ncbi:hypothetical protein AAG906_000548 [Vitis piasezkii]
MPIPSCKFSKSMNEWRIVVFVVFRYEEKVPQGHHAGESPPLPNISLCNGPILPHKATSRKHVCCTCVAREDVLDNNLELTSGLQEHAMSLGPKGSNTHRAALTGDTGTLSKTLQDKNKGNNG